MYCEYSTGSGIDRKNQRMREVERVVGWILILFRWLIAMPDRAARILETGRTVVAGMVVVDWAVAQWGWRLRERGSLVQELPHLLSIPWMTYCLGQGWISAPPGLMPALVSRASALPSRESSRGVQGAAFCGATSFILNDHFLSCFECARGFKALPSGHWVTQPTSRCSHAPPVSSRRSVPWAGPHVGSRIVGL